MPVASASSASPARAAPRAGEILVLGATGFIGRRLLARLLERGAPVSVLARRAQALPEPLASAVQSGAVRLFHGALSAAPEQRDNLLRALEGASCVLHLATGGGASWEEIERSMVAGSRALAEACAESGVRRLVYVSSTAALYLGRDCGSRVIEDDGGTDPRPRERALYARGKIAAEAALRSVADARSLGLVIARPGVVLGPGTPMQHSGLGLWVRDNHCVGWGRGERPLPLVLADDVAEALARIALHRGGELNGRALNLASCVPLGARALVEAFARASGRALHFHPRALAASQTMEIGKWLVKRAGGRADAPFPPWRDLKSRELWPALSARNARVLLGWQPVEDAQAFLDGACAGLRRD
jgi:nucleoside-diphosphate-sugar epimerase